MPPPFNVMLSSAGHRVALMNCFREALTTLKLDGELLAVDLSRYSSAYQLADRSWTVPRATAPEFIPRMLEICEREAVSLLVPTIDVEAETLSANREAFTKIGTHVMISAPEVIRIASDKVLTHKWLSEEGLDTPRQGSVADVLSAPADWSYPLIAKPVNGSCSIGVEVVHNAEELSHASRDEAYIVQSIAPGVEYTVSVYANRGGQALCAVPRERLEVRNGEGFKARAVRNAAIEELACRVINRLPGASGVLNVQIFHDAKTGELNIIEINPRFGGGYPLAWHAGARYPQWLIEELRGLPSSASANGWTGGMVMLRYDDAVFVPAGAVQS